MSQNTKKKVMHQVTSLTQQGAKRSVVMMTHPWLPIVTTGALAVITAAHVITFEMHASNNIWPIAAAVTAIIYAACAHVILRRSVALLHDAHTDVWFFQTSPLVHCVAVVNTKCTPHEVTHLHYSPFGGRRFTPATWLTEHYEQRGLPLEFATEPLLYKSVEIADLAKLKGKASDTNPTLDR